MDVVIQIGVDQKIGVALLVTCFQLNANGPLISWKSKKQQSVALSTCETEYIALAAAVQEAKFLRELLADMQGTDVKSVNIPVDNQGAIALAKNPVYHRDQNIDIRYHFIISEVQEGVVSLSYVQSETNLADLFTNPVSKVKLKLFLMLKECKLMLDCRNCYMSFLAILKCVSS